jgi:hypothetical protein
VVIVSVTRDDLRDEFAMADEAFALSPISARAAQPSEGDYDAISQAFMETSRGRWFLGEYAKRNRNADTRMVLDAVARIEEALAAQRQPAPESGLAEALAAIRHAVDEAAAVASAALEGLALEQHLAPVRKGARVIKEIAWRWREIGADGRICDLLDSQVGAIEGACGQISSAGALGALSAAFELIKGRIAEFGDGDTAAPQAAEEAMPSPSPAPSDEMPAVMAEEARTATATNDAEAAISTPALQVEADVATAEAVDVTAETAEVMADAPDMTAEAADAHDEAVLDMVALEMAAPDPSDIDDPYGTDTDEIDVAELPPADPTIVAERPEPVAAPVPLPAVQHSIQPSVRPSLQPSLGSTLIANGIVRRPTASVADPLAPIRRMSQAEKIALFS